MKGWRRLTEVGQVGLVVPVVLWKVQVTFKVFLLPFLAQFIITGTSNPPNASDSWFNDFLSRSNPINETQSSSGRRNSSSAWPRNNDNMDARHNKTGEDMGVGLYDGKKESAVRGEGVGIGEDRTGQDITILTSAEERVSEGNGGNIKNEDARSDADKT